MKPILYPFAFVFWHVGEALYHFMGVEPTHQGTSHSEDDIRKMVSASEKGGSIDPVESRLIDNVFDFADRVAREVMVPRQDMVCLFVDDPIEENMKVIRESGHTRYPLCEEDRDHILGMVHIREFMNADYKEPGFDLRSIMREIDVVPESMSIAKILQLMQHKHVQMAAVADEYGGTAGLVTMEDLLEEIVGDIQDEHDSDMPEINKMPDGSYVFDGLVLLDEVSEIMGIQFDDPEEDTIGGYVFGLIGRQPVVGDSVEENGCKFEVLDSTGFRVLRVRVIPLKKEKKEAAGHEQ
ncbi:hemolysin family protein [Acidaminococcus sp. LBK-2]|uniref:hemolysin family protein n=1 Tax=Acidaminococcus sp. LBK-2 TaxID=3456956 RepID=UPI003FA438B2